MPRDGLLAKLESDGVQLIEVYSADNALARVADPHLLGHADLCGADICEPFNSALSHFPACSMKTACGTGKVVCRSLWRSAEPSIVSHEQALTV